MASPYQALYDQFETSTGQTGNAPSGSGGGNMTSGSMGSGVANTSQTIPAWMQAAQAMTGTTTANGQQLLSAANPWTPANPSVDWNPYAPPAYPDPSGGSPINQWPGTTLPPGVGGNPKPGTSSDREGAWALPIGGVLGALGFPTPPAAMGPNGTKAPALGPNDFGYWTGENAKTIGNWAQVMGPIMQILQNADQFQQEAAEGGRRFDAEFNRTLGNDQFQRDLTTRQQNFQETQADVQQGNFVRQLEWQMGNDMAAREIANRETAVLESRLGVEQAAQRWNEIYQQKMLELEGQRIEQQREAARYAAFGRAQAPVQWRGNWR